VARVFDRAIPDADHEAAPLGARDVPEARRRGAGHRRAA
jgi:hypothetical protein